MGMDCIAIIPARYGSARFPGKPLATLAGRPMIQHVIERCRATPGIEGVVVATDDERIASAARAAEAIALETPPELSSGTDRVAMAARRYPARVIVNVQGDEPLIDPEALGGAVAEFSGSGADFGTLRSPLGEMRDLWDPNVVKVVVDRDGRALYFSRAPVPFPRRAATSVRRREDRTVIEFREEAAGPARRWIHVGVYLYSRSGLERWATLSPSELEAAEGLEQLRLLEAGETIVTYPVAEALPGVDTPEDLERVRAYLTGS